MLTPSKDITPAFRHDTIGESPNDQTFTVHKNLICHHPSFFNAAFTDTGFIEGQTQSMAMEDIDSEIFGLLVHWLYTKEIRLEGLKEGNKSCNDPRVDACLIPLGRLWMLAERYLIRDLQNLAVSCLVHTALRFPPGFMKLAQYLHQELGEVEDHSLKRLVVDFITFNATEGLIRVVSSAVI
jgi:hypothetical protein